MVRSHREEADMPETYVTKAGDSLTSIAEQAYGDGSRWSEIYEANRKAIGDDPDLIKVGMKLTIPHGGAGSATYVTSAGDALWHVAEVMYNDGSRWPRDLQGQQEAHRRRPGEARRRARAEDSCIDRWL
jgi:nucleoid-associated protein YgaU